MSPHSKWKLRHKHDVADAALGGDQYRCEHCRAFVSTWTEVVDHEAVCEANPEWLADLRGLEVRRCSPPHCAAGST